MRYIKQALCGLFLVFLANQTLAHNKIIICTDTNFWYPFTYVQHHEVTGLHIDIISHALRNLGIEPVFTATTWKECLNHAKDGLVDAVATASYRDERALYLNYPEGAAVDSKSPWRVTQVGYVVVTPAFNKQGEKNIYRFNGTFKNIPEPIRVPVHYSVIHDLEKEGLKIKQGRTSLDNFKNLVRENTGSVIDVEEAARLFATQPEFAGKVVIQQKHLNNKSYYLAFSKKGVFKTNEAQEIWQEIARVRDNPKLMAEFLKKY